MIGIVRITMETWSNLTDKAVKAYFKAAAANGINLVRFWGFADGVTSPPSDAVQPTVGVFNELALKRFDLVLSEAAKNGIKVIFSLVNGDAYLGGPQWYYNQVVGNSQPGGHWELFYTNPKIIAAYQSYAKTILTRKNTITGVLYKDDPTIMAVELANHPHTTTDLERVFFGGDIAPGTLVNYWVSVNAAFIRAIDPHHMICTGDGGFMADVTAAPGDPVYPNALEDGAFGVDFARNLADPNISFGTVHLFPGKWSVQPQDAGAFANTFLYKRALAAAKIGKPIIVEEVGMASYDLPLGQFMAEMFSAAQASGAAAIMPYKFVPYPYNYSAALYEFGTNSDADSTAVTGMVNYQAQRTLDCASGTCPPIAPCPAGTSSAAGSGLCWTVLSDQGSSYGAIYAPGGAGAGLSDHTGAGDYGSNAVLSSAHTVLPGETLTLHIVVEAFNGFSMPFQPIDTTMHFTPDSDPNSAFRLAEARLDVYDAADPAYPSASSLYSSLFDPNSKQAGPYLGNILSEQDFSNMAIPFTGPSHVFVETVSLDLSPYAGKTVYFAYRSVDTTTDSGILAFFVQVESFAVAC
ncbi:hypothetical protein WJX81_007392 [Elliptochloris bilobata]|uniref:mannan endo-1,4-beta-mannosidase n=1 Tax=Elliptochloris bilobata TaxID=381761 RepID=A0AAW1S0K6_9CHLO